MIVEGNLFFWHILVLTKSRETAEILHTPNQVVGKNILVDGFNSAFIKIFKLRKNTKFSYPPNFLKGMPVNGIFSKSCSRLFHFRGLMLNLETRAKHFSIQILNEFENKPCEF